MQPPRRRLRALVHKSTAWGREAPFRSRVISVGHLLSGNVASAVLALMAVALTARAVGPTEYGILALVLTYARAVERLVTFQSWQPIIKYGAALDDPARRDDLRRLLKFGFVLDAGGALLAWLTAIVLAVIAVPLFGWNDRALVFVVIYCTSLLFNINGTPTAILRLSGRYRAAAYGPVASQAVRLAACAVGVAMDASLTVFVAIWMVTQIIGSLSFLAFAVLELRRQGVTGVFAAPLSGISERFPSIWNFAWSSNLSLTFRSSAEEFDTLLVGALAGPTAAGLYHIAKRVGRLAQQVGVQVQAVLYPDVARMWAAGELAAMRRAVWQIEVLLLGFGLAGVAFLWLTAAPLLRLTVGPEFVAAAPLVIIQMFAVTLTMTGSAARSALLAMGRQNEVLRTVMIATGAFHVTALVMIPAIGAMGANVAHIVLGLIWLVGMAHEFRRALQEPKA